MATHVCPKCGSPSARYVQDGPDIWERCLCGLMKLAHTALEKGYEVTNCPVSTRELSLPGSGTLLSKVLATVRVLGLCRTDEVRDALSDRGIAISTDQVGSSLSYLCWRGLVECREKGRGKQGGGMWGLTPQYSRMIQKGD